MHASHAKSTPSRSIFLKFIRDQNSCEKTIDSATMRSRNNLMLVLLPLLITWFSVDSFQWLNKKNDLGTVLPKFRVLPFIVVFTWLLWIHFVDWKYSLRWLCPKNNFWTLYLFESYAKNNQYCDNTNLQHLRSLPLFNNHLIYCGFFS